MKSWKKVIAASLLALVIGGIAQAKTTESVPVGKGYDPYPGFIIADMSMENGVVSNNAAYSMRYFHNFGLIRLPIVRQQVAILAPIIPFMSIHITIV